MERKQSVLIFVSVSLILSLGIAVVLVCQSCKPSSVDDITVKIDDSDQLAWRCFIGNKIVVHVKAYLFPASSGIEKAFKRRRDLRKNAIQELREKECKATSKKLKELHIKGIELYEEELETYVPSWADWPVVILSPVLLESPKPTKALAMCKYDKRLADIAITLFSAEEVSCKDLIRVVRIITKHFEAFSDDEWVSFPLENEPLFDNVGEIISHKFDKFAEDAIFIEQR